MNLRPVTTEPITFLLGCERSGSTWLANILDAHEAVELLMEPFVPYASLFPGFPTRHEDASQVSKEMEESVRRGLRLALPLKYPLLYRPGRSPRLSSVDAALVRFGHRASRRLLGKSPLACRRWELLNLNHSEIPTDLRSRKRWPPSQYVVKELRLNLRVPVLKAAFPDARYIVIVRNPAAQLTSVRKWIAQGRLQELASELKMLPLALEQNTSLQRYRRFMGNGEMSDVLAVWWFINYETVLADLRRHGLPALLIRHEDLATDPQARTAEILAFLGLPRSGSVTRYVERSSASEQRTSSPVDTFRKSAEHSRDSIRAADRALADRLQDVAERLPVCDELRGYFRD